MASRRLHLYADGNSTSGVNYDFDGNITLNCIANCVGVCFYGICFPPPPLPPASLLDGNNSGESATPIHLHSHGRLFSTLIIAIVSAVAGSFTLLAIYTIFCFRRRARRRRHLSETAAAATIGDATDEDETGGDLPPGGEVEHHIWYIRTQGLDESTIASITSWVYKSSDGLIDNRDCSVCLGEFHDGELVRLLPKCNHAFHLQCIDKWLRSHVNCPLCRSHIVSPAIVSIPVPSSTPHSTVISVPEEMEIGSPAPPEILQIEALPRENDTEGIELGILIRPSAESSNLLSTSDFPPNSLEEGESLQPIRRSISMDSLSLDAIFREERTEEEVQEVDGRASANYEKARGFLNVNLLRKIPQKMERSLSSQSARWFFSRHGHPRNSVLPL